MGAKGSHVFDITWCGFGFEKRPKLDGMPFEHVN
jgi:hypothetical protein